MDISPNKPLSVLLRNAGEADQQRLDSMSLYLTRMAKLEQMTLLKDGEEAPASASAIVGDMEVLIPMAGLIDKDAELARLTKAIEKIEKDVARTEGKLSTWS